MVLVDITAQIIDTSLVNSPHSPLDCPIQFTVVRTDNQHLLREEEGASVPAAWFIGVMFGHLGVSAPDGVQQFLNRLEAGKWAELTSFPAPDKAIHTLTVRD